jgi:hypothetical protein
MRVAIAAALLFVFAGAGTAEAQAAPRATLSLQPGSKLSSKAPRAYARIAARPSP